MFSSDREQLLRIRDYIKENYPEHYNESDYWSDSIISLIEKLDDDKNKKYKTTTITMEIGGDELIKAIKKHLSS